MTVQGWLSKITSDTDGKIPKQGDAVVSNFVVNLWKESQLWRQSAFERRIGESLKTYHDPFLFWQQCRKMEQGNHWEVWGRRNTAPGDEWKHELSDPETGNQIRVKKAYLTASWHDVTIFPNIENINKVLDQERDDTRWGDVIGQGVHKGLTEGTCVFMSVFDKTRDRDGQAREIVCDNASIFPTPYATSFDKIDGCFSAETEFFADGRLTRFGDVVGTTVNVLTKDGTWRPAEVKCFGTQKLYTVRFSPFGMRSNFSLQYEATSNHRWFTTNRGDVDDLRVGDRVLIIPRKSDKESKDYTDGFIHGIIFGDGTIDSGSRPEKFRHKIHLYGSKQRYAGLLKSYQGYISADPEPSSQHRYQEPEMIVRLSSVINMKALPCEGKSFDYKAGFVDGWLSMDGSLRSDGRGGNRLSSINDEAIEWLIYHAPLTGYCVTGVMVDSSVETNYGKRNSPLKILTLVDEPTEYIVKSITDEGKFEDVFCIVEPETHSFTLAGGLVTSNCWYVVYATLEQRRFVEEQYPDLKAALTELDAARAREISMNTDVTHGYTSTYSGLVDKLVCWMDDPQLEKIPAEPEEINQEHAAFHQGQDVPVLRDQNHAEHVRAHTDWLENTVNSVPQDQMTPQDQQFSEALTNVVLMHIQDHIKIGQQKEDIDGIPIGKRKKYPYGRRIVVVANQVAEDEPNPYEFDWRNLFHKWEPEKLPESFWGRGIPEVLWQTQHTLDTMASRVADISLAVGTPQMWFHVTDKSTLSENPPNNDPDQPKYYSTQPPVFRQGQSPQENLAIYNMAKNDAQRQLGVSEVTYGEAPTTQASGELAQTLLRQNQIIVSGEANQRLSNIIASIIETRLMMWRQFYTEPRLYYLEGQFRPVTLSKTLSVQKVTQPDGSIVEKPIPLFQVSVRPGSNVANQWELDFNFATQLFNLRGPDGMPLIPKEALFDILAQRYPQFSRDSQYYQLGDATKIGLQVMSQENAKKKQDTRLLRKVQSKFQQKGLEEVLTQGQPTNGGQQ